MSDTVEIYVCQPGQELKKGKLFVANDIFDKNDARADAKERCAVDQSIERIQYYQMYESGDFRLLLKYVNPTVKKSAPAKKTTVREPTIHSVRKVPDKKRGLWALIKSLFG